MARQFWVNNYFIDVTRNQIQHQQQATQLPPKALKVLEVLASRVGQVVSHDEIMDEVWQNSVVAPNTLQRSIAQLRKAFGDDSKQQAFIKTHAKKGYSLEANVRWSDEQEPTALVIGTSDLEVNQRIRHWIPISAAFAFICVMFAFYLLKSPEQTYSHMRPITASDEQEFNATYSPDGKYLVFNRFEEQCNSHLWAKDLSNNQEVQLSKEPGLYSRLSWSSDGTQLAFVVQSSCPDMPSEIEQCWQLQTFDFAEAWNGNGRNLLRYDCANIETSQPVWLNDGRIALLQHSGTEVGNAKVVIFDPRSDSLEQVNIGLDGEIYSLDYSRTSGLLAAVIWAENNQHILATFTPDGELKSNAPIQREAYHSTYQRFPIRFLPDAEHLLTDVKGQIYKLDLAGNLNLIHPQTYKDLWMPTHHPVETKFIVTHGPKDSDIGVVNLTQPDHTFIPISRSTSVDVNAQFQPGGELIAFISYQSGNSQIWLHGEEKTYQLTHFDDGIYSALFSWSPDGNSVAVNLHNQLAIVDLNGDYRKLVSPIAIKTIMPWTQSEKILVTADTGERDQLYVVDLRTGEAEPTGLSNILWASLTDGGDIIYRDTAKQFWLYAAEKSERITTIGSGLDGKHSILKNGSIIGIDAQNRLQRYHIGSDELITLATLDKDVSYVSDFKQDEILVTKFMGGRRELVEFSLQD
ncbi:winged helix-turn-helix domain-containing protein [Alteromonas facilis]|uniref:winged helix-turn-helix domain-containing protein n=1 Tax=Alteromonas facilis TaxID=2048004 RepID=UPI000C28FE1F|nr:winged helix-turn-helix domain-containing protein [Alteromonas facilis]